MAAKVKGQQPATTVVTAAEGDVEEPPGSRRRIRASAAPTGRSGRIGAPRTVAALLEADTDLIVQVESKPLPPKAEPRRPREIRARSPRRTDLRDVEVVVLFSQALAMARGRPEDVLADQETEQVAAEVVKALEGVAAKAAAVGVWEDLRPALRGLPADAAVFNLVESLGGQAYTEYLPPRRFQRQGLRYTGAPAEALRLSGNKLLAKKVFEANGLATPRYQVVRRAGQVRFDVPLPAIVKPATEGGSLGITHDSIVHDATALAARVDYVLETYRQPALIEEFIAGRELNVAVWGNSRPEVLPISEIDFRWTDDPLRKIVSFASKWQVDSVEYRETPGVCPAPLKPAERKRVEAAALKAYTLLGVEGYARVDIRLRQGVPYLLEVNANPDLAPEAGFFRSAKAAGYTYATMIAHILELGLERPAARPRQIPLPLAPDFAAAAA